MTAPLLQVEGLARHFGGLRALDEVDLRLEAGEILGLIGPNGAGKSTLFNCVAGALRATAGRVAFAGRDVTGLNAARRARLGIGRTFQLGKVFRAMTVRDNVTAGFGLQRYGSFWRSLTGRIDGARVRAHCDALLDRFDLAGYAAAQASELPMGIQRRVEVARTMAGAPKLLLLDEPAAGLTHGEATAFAELVRGLRADGVSVIVIEHNMRFAMDLAERMYVLVQGRMIAEGTPDAVRRDPAVVAAYLG
jgi:ABC-type branched-subunit amino acid transport system ATPase component